MTKYTTIKFFFFISFFPVWISRSNLNFYEILFAITLFLIIPFLIIFTIFKEKNFSKNYFLYLIAFIFTYGLDNHLGLKSGIDNSMYLIFNQQNIYDPGFALFNYLVGISIFFLISIFVFILIKISDFKFIKIILIFMLTIGIFNFFDSSKSYKQIVNFEKNIEINNFKKTTLVLIFDSMSGINNHESQHLEGKEFLKISDKFFKKFDFHIYNNARSIIDHTQASIVNLTNLTDDITYDETNQKFKNSLGFDNYIQKTNNYFQPWKQTKNLLFEKFNQISVYQGIATNYCDTNKVFKCLTFNPFNSKEFIDGFKNTTLSKVVSINKMNGSITSHYIWRILNQFRITDSMIMPDIERPLLQNALKKVENDIYSQKYDLIFLHILVPHLPYGFGEKCNFDGSKSLNISFLDEREKIRLYNNERVCVIKFLDNFLSNIKDNNRLDNLDIIILGDHGSKTIEAINKETRNFSTILAHRNVTIKHYEDNTKITIQEFFKNYFN